MRRPSAPHFQLSIPALILFLLVCISRVTAQPAALVQPLPRPAEQLQPISELDEVLYSQDWESEHHGWELLDGYDMIDTLWHVDSLNGTPENTYSWRCSAPSPAFAPEGGYWGMWYQAVRLPPVNLEGQASVSLSFSFKLRSAAQDSSDGAFVLIHSDLFGETHPLAHFDITPFNTDSLGSVNGAFDLYHPSFGATPGWVGTPQMATWRRARTDLSIFHYPDAEISIVFCSDAWVDTRTNNGWTGMQLDSIAITTLDDTLYFNDPDNPYSMPLSQESGYPSTPHSFERTERENTHSGDFVFRMDDYEPRVMHVLESPWIPLPAVQPGQSIRFDTWVRGEYQWDIVARDRFYFDLWVKPSDLEMWYPASAPYSNDTSTVCSGAPGEEWVRQSEDWNVTWDGTPYAGREVKFRLVARLPRVEPESFSYFEMDDFEVVLTSAEHDVALTNLRVPYPTTEGFPISPRVLLSNPGQTSAEGIEVYLQADHDLLTLDPAPPYQLDPGESVELSIVHGWNPDSPGSCTIASWLEYDEDEVAGNDSVSMNVEVLEYPRYEFGHDERVPQTITLIQSDPDTSQGILWKMHDRFEDYRDELWRIHLDTIRVLCYKPPMEVWPDTLRMRLQLSRAWSDSIQVADVELDFSWEPALGNLFWVSFPIPDSPVVGGNSTVYAWLELFTTVNQQVMLPYLVSDPGDEDGRYFLYDGQTAIESESDFFIRALTRGEYNDVAETGYGLPTRLSLEAPWPNPFNSTTTVRVALPEAQTLRLTVFDVLGRQVATIAQGRYMAGRHAFAWNAEDIAGGVYFLRLEIADQRPLMQKVVLIR